MGSEWHTAPLSHISEIQTGPFGSQLHNEDYVQVGTPIVTVEHLGRRRFTTQNLPLVSGKDKKRLSKYILETGDIVFSRVGSVDRCSFVELDHQGWLFSGRCLRVRPNKKSIDPKYLYYYLTHEDTKQYIRNIAVGATMPSINTTLMGEVLVRLPTLPEQHAIAATLSCLDDKIELNTRIIANLEAQAQAIFKSWFVDFEPWGYRKPASWDVSTLGDVSLMIAGGDKPKSFSEKLTTEHSIPIYSNGIDNEGLFGYTDTARITSKSVTVSARGTIGYVCYRREPYLPIVRLISLVPDLSKISSIYLYHWLRNIGISGNGTTQQQLTVPNFKTTEILIPVFEIVDKFTNIVDPMFSKIAILKAMNRTIATTRDTLLPKLMSGEIEVLVQ